MRWYANVLAVGGGTVLAVYHQRGFVLAFPRLRAGFVVSFQNYALDLPLMKPKGQAAGNWCCKLIRPEAGLLASVRQIKQRHSASSNVRRAKTSGYGGWGLRDPRL